MKGLVLAGGSGTRLRPLTHTGAKQLVPVANRPILFYVVDNLVDAGITDIVMIISPETGDEIRKTVGTGERWNARISYVVQDRPGGLAHAVATARPSLGDDDFCMFLGDNLIGTMIKDAVTRFRSDHSVEAALMLKEVPNPSSFGVAEVDAKGRVISLEEKPKAPKSNLALVGIYMFRKSIFQAISEIKPSARGELEITDAIARLVSTGKEVRFDRVESWWLDTGKKDDMLLANDTVLDSWIQSETHGEVDADSLISGRVSIGKGAKITRSILRGPMVIGENVEVTDSKIGPFTSIGAGTKIQKSTIEHSVILEQAQIESIARLEDSLIGRRVVIHPGDARAARLSLLVGDDCRIELS